MWSLSQDRSPRLDQWLHLENFCYDSPLTPAGDLDSTDESLISTPAESPALNMRDLLVDSGHYGGPMEYDNKPQDGILFLNDRVDAFDGPHFGGGGCHPAHSTPGYHEIGYGGRTRNGPRQRLIQRHDPYPRPSQGTSKLPAPHSDQFDLEAQSRYGPSNAGPAYRRSPASEDRLLDDDTRPLAIYTPSPLAPAPMALSPSAFHRAPIDTDKRLRGELGLPPGAPVNLWSVLDTGRTDGSRPKLSLPMLAQLAIHGSENRMLTLQGIMQAIKDRFRWYHETTDKGWQNSMRHALSLYSVFVRVERPVHHAGKGAYWTLSTSFDDQYDQYKRLRKRAGNEKQTPKIASNRVASPNVTANVCSPVPAPPSLEHRQNSPSPMPDKHDASEHSEWAQANIDPKLLDRPSSFISYQTNASSNRDVNYVAGTQEQSIEAAPADRAEISTSRRLLSRSDSFKLPSSDPASTSPTASKKGRHTRA